jgi:hypothetical protein
MLKKIQLHPKKEQYKRVKQRKDENIAYNANELNFIIFNN